jgi:membrane protein implicated in regulation of membrane protease activity
MHTPVKNSHQDQPFLAKKGTFKRRNTWLLFAYLAIVAACLLPAFGIAFNSAELVLRIPISILWLTCCFLALALLTAIAYRCVFSLWARDIDSPDEKANPEKREN